MNETIAQIATPIGEGGISIIKISGDDSLIIMQKIFKPIKKIEEYQTHKLNYGHIYNDNKKIDEVLVSFMKAPYTYTGENIVEINCHGGILITQKILGIIINYGARLANPGEFTQRAFLNGKKNIEEVDTIYNLIHAQNDTALNLAINSLNNSTKDLIEQLRQKLLEIVTNIEVNIDYPEYEDIKVVKHDDLKQLINNYQKLIKNIIQDSKNGEILKNGIQTAIIGKPNVGKSSILNYLSKNDKAIVTNIAGTTRDTVENKINLDNLTLNLIDTAGIRETEDIVEKIGVEKSYKALEEAELVAYVIDGSQEELSKEEILLWKNIKTKKIMIINKVDKINNQLKEELSKLNIEDYIFMSAKEKKGEKDLINIIKQKYNLQNFDPNNSKYIPQMDTVFKLEKVQQIIDKVQQMIEEEFFLDLILIDLKEGLYILGDILGINVKEDYLNEMFSRFCLGK